MKAKNPRFDIISVFLFMICLFIMFLNVNRIKTSNKNLLHLQNTNILPSFSELHNANVFTNIEHKKNDIQPMCSSLQNFKIVLDGTTLVSFPDQSMFTKIANSQSTINGELDSTTMNSFNWFTTSLNKWEISTFLVFKALIKPHMIYIGFGEWIGPTILYSSQLAKKSYGLEPDNNAFKSLAMNAYANNCFDNKLNIFPYCIYSTSGSFQLKDAIGGSGASLKQNADDIGFSGGNFQSTTCFTLQNFLEMENLINEHLFIKVDTEGTEADLFESFSILLPKLKYKPIWYISKHANDKYDNINLKKEILKFANNFKCAKAATASHLTLWNSDSLNQYSVMNLPSIDIDSILSESNPDWILADYDCKLIDKWINEAKIHF